MEGMFSEVYPGHPQEIISNFKKCILRLSEAYRELSTLGSTLSLRNIKRTISRTLYTEDLEKDQLN